MTVTDLGKKAAGSSVGKMTIKDAINALPTAYRKITFPPRKEKWKKKETNKTKEKELSTNPSLPIAAIRKNN